MHCSAESKKRMAAGEEPDCLIDAWIKAMIEAKQANETQDGEKALLNREYSDHEIAMVLLSFLFASQGKPCLLAFHRDALAVYFGKLEEILTLCDFLSRRHDFWSHLCFPIYGRLP